MRVLESFLTIAAVLYRKSIGMTRHCHTLETSGGDDGFPRRGELYKSCTTKFSGIPA